MKNPAIGMQMFHEQVNDRQKWHGAMEERERLITKAKQLGIKLKNPGSMKMSDIKEEIRKGYQRNNEKHSVRGSKRNR